MLTFYLLCSFLVFSPLYAGGEPSKEAPISQDTSVSRGTSSSAGTGRVPAGAYPARDGAGEWRVNSDDEQQKGAGDSFVAVTGTVAAAKEKHGGTLGGDKK